MKKLMITAAAALCATIGYSEITSANVVGYSTKELGAGFTSITPEFIQVNGVQQITLADIKGVFSEGDSIQVFGNGGDVDAEYFYCEEGSLVEGPTGWYMDDFETPAGTTPIKAGSEFWFSAQDTASVTIAGQVNTNDVVIELDVGFTPVGNCSPVTLTLDDLIFEGLSEGDSIQVFGNGGDVDAEYFYCVEGSLVEGATGWYADDFETPAGTQPIAAGTGFWTNCQDVGATVTIPAAL